MAKSYFRVVEITNNPSEYPEAVKDTEEFPDLIEEIEDEAALFVVQILDGKAFQYWPAAEFFMMIKIKTFESEDFEP